VVGSVREDDRRLSAEPVESVLCHALGGCGPASPGPGIGEARTGFGELFLDPPGGAQLFLLRRAGGVSSQAGICQRPFSVSDGPAALTFGPRRSVFGRWPGCRLGRRPGTCAGRRP
jgi:hypothetical protein